MSPLVIAHRGASYELPEHTIEAYRRAIDQGADGLECDVRMTRDGHLVCIHDGRLDRTSSGNGRVSAASLDELERLDFGGRHPRRPSDGGPYRVLTLQRLLETVLDSGRRLQLLIETKHPSRYGAAVEDAVAQLLRKYGLAEPEPRAPVTATVMSFSPLALRHMRILAPAVPTAFLFEVVAPAIRDGRTPYGARVLGPSIAALRARPELVARAHERGREVFVWTVNHEADIDLALRCGVDAIITDRPALIRTRLDGW